MQQRRIKNKQRAAKVRVRVHVAIIEKWTRERTRLLLKQISEKDGAARVHVQQREREKDRGRKRERERERGWGFQGLPASPFVDWIVKQAKYILLVML